MYLHRYVNLQLVWKDIHLLAKLWDCEIILSTEGLDEVWGIFNYLYIFIYQMCNGVACCHTKAYCNVYHFTDFSSEFIKLLLFCMYP